MENKNPQTGKGTGGDFSFESIVAKPLSAKASENAQQTQHSAKASNRQFCYAIHQIHLSARTHLYAVQIYQPKYALFQMACNQD